MNHPDLLIYQELLQSLQDTYYTSIVRYDDDGRRPFLDINKNLFQNPLIHTLAVQIGINPIILASLISHLQGVGFLKGAKVVVPSSVTLENKIFLQHQTTLVKNSNEIAFDPETIINLHRYIHKFACIPCIQRLCGQDFEYILSTKPHGFFGTNSLYDWHYATYASIWDYMEFLCCNYEQCNFILGTQRAVDTLLNIDTWTPDGYQDTIYDMTPPLWSNIQPIWDIILGDNTYWLNLIVHNTYLPYGLSFSLWLDLYDTQGILHRDTKLYMVNVVFEPWAELNTVVINTIQQSCRHVYYRIECNQIQLYYNTSHLANANETSVNHDDYVKPFLHKAVMDFFVDKHGSKLLHQLIGDKIHKSVITWDISSKIANQANYMHKLIEKHYHEYMRRSYDPTILLTAFISYIFSYHYRVCIIAPWENLRSMYHIDDFDVGKKRSEKNYSIKGQTLGWTLIPNGRYVLSRSTVSGILSDRCDGLGIYAIDGLTHARNKLFQWSILDLDVCIQQHSDQYQMDLVHSIETYKSSTHRLIYNFSH